MSQHPLQHNEPYPSQLDLVIADVLRELDLASCKFGPFPTSMHGYAVILEELDEMWAEIKQNNTNRAREECVQVAAMAIRFLMDIE